MDNRRGWDATIGIGPSLHPTIGDPIDDSPASAGTCAAPAASRPRRRSAARRGGGGSVSSPPNGRYCKVSGQESFCFSTLPHHPAGRQQSCRTRLSVDKSIEATTPHGPATWLGACVVGVERRCECSELARTAYGACASDGRSADAWTERAPILRGREGVNVKRNVISRANGKK